MATQYADETDLSQVGMSAKQLTLVSTGQKTAALVAASSVADGYLAAQYDSLPLTTWPESLRTCVARLAAWTLISGPIGFNPDGSHEVFLENQKQAMKWLQDVGNNRVHLPKYSAAPARGVTPTVVSDTSRGF
jgi:phage gp36-like protein